MDTIKKVKANKIGASNDATINRVTVGRKRDGALDARIIESAIHILAEAGFNNMTMDMVAARAKSGKTTVYRRWASKGELVRDALISMSRSSVELDRLPETGTLRGDLLALMKPYSKKHSEQKLQVLAKLGSFFSDYPKLSEEAIAAIFGSWTDVNRVLMQKAVERGEIPAEADVEMACEIIVSINSYRTLTQKKPFDKFTYAALLDNILLPALKNPK